jgi:RHS repeat-associated protein
MIFSSSVSGAWFLRDSLGRIAGRSPQNFADASGFSYNADGSLKHWSLAPQGGNCQTFNPSYGYECLVGIPTQETDYTYDNVGNVTSGGASYAANRLTAANGYSMTYDEDGNLKSKSGSGFSQTLNWNSLGQLTSVTTNGTTTTFGYDGLGRRVRKSVNGGATTGYLYSGDNLYLELDSNGNPVTEYAYWPSVDAPNAISKGGQSYYLTQDPQSANITSVVRASDNSVQASYDYTPFGTLRSGWFDNVGNSLQFAARQYDTETGLIYFRARYYDPQVARFVSEDPLGLGGGINPYVYAGNDPINASDPSGLAVEDGSDCTSKTLPGGGIEVDCPKNKGGGSPTPANPQGPGPVVSDPPAPGGGGSPLGAGSADNGQTVPVSYKPVKQCSAMMSLLVNQLRAQQSAASSEGLERGGIVRYLLDGTLVASRSELPGSRAPRRVSVVWDARGTADWHVHLFRRPGQGPSNLDTLSTMISGHSFLVGPDSAFEMWRDGNHVERTGCQP